MVWQLVRQLVYTMFITYNHDSFHLWWKENFVKHQKVSKYYGQDCSFLSKRTEELIMFIFQVLNLISLLLPRNGNLRMDISIKPDRFLKFIATLCMWVNYN